MRFDMSKRLIYPSTDPQDRVADITADPMGRSIGRRIDLKDRTLTDAQLLPDVDEIKTTLRVVNI